jgi:hypothetical protein
LYFNTQSGVIHDAKSLRSSIESGLYLPVEEAIAILNQFEAQVKNYDVNQHEDI